MDVERYEFNKNDPKWQCFCGYRYSNALKIVCCLMEIGCGLYILSLNLVGIIIAIVGIISCICPLLGLYDTEPKLVLPFMILTVSFFK